MAGEAWEYGPAEKTCRCSVETKKFTLTLDTGAWPRKK
jgi:hypothetical protein